MATWTEFTTSAPRVSTTFIRRHAATNWLCMLGTLRSDGFPRISPVEPRIFEDRLLIIGMPRTSKFRDLARDPRFTLHTATIDTHVSDGDAKLWGTVDNVQDPELHQRFAEWLYAESGFDLRGQTFDQFFVADILGASSVEVGTGLEVTIWKPGQEERVIQR